MKYVYMIIFLLAGAAGVYAVAADSESVSKLSPRAEEMSMNCNLEARNSLVSGDTASVETTCKQAIEEIEKTHRGKEDVINPIMNLAFAYTLSGQFDKAMPLYNKARNIREKLYGSDSKQLEEIDYMIRQQEEILRKQHKK